MKRMVLGLVCAVVLFGLASQARAENGYYGDDMMCDTNWTVEMIEGAIMMGESLDDLIYQYGSDPCFQSALDEYYYYWGSSYYCSSYYAEMLQVMMLGITPASFIPSHVSLRQFLFIWGMIYYQSMFSDEGELTGNLSLSLGSFDIEDLDVDGDSRELEFTLSTPVGDGGFFSLTLSKSWTEIDDPVSLETDAIGMDLIYNQKVNDQLDLGVLAFVGRVDTDDTSADGVFGIGPVVAFHGEITDAMTMGVATSLVQINSSDNDTVLFAAMFDAQYMVSENCGILAYAQFNDPIDEDEVDQAFWTIGGDVVYKFNDRVGMEFGYSTNVGYDGIEDSHLWTVGLNYDF